MSDFRAKMHQIVCRLGLRPRPRWGNFFTALPRLPSWILGGLLLREGREGTPCSPVTPPIHYILYKRRGNWSCVAHRCPRVMSTRSRGWDRIETSSRFFLSAENLSADSDTNLSHDVNSPLRCPIHNVAQ